MLPVPCPRSGVRTARLSLPGSTQPAKAKKGTGPASRWAASRRSHTLPGCMGCGPKCSGSAGRGHCAILAARSRVGTPKLRCRARQLNESRLELLGFTIPPAWPCHAVPPLHKGGFFFAQANTTGPSSHNPHGCSVALGPYRAPPGARKRSGVRWPDGQAVLPHQIAQQSQTQKSSPEQQESFFLCVNPNTEALYTLLPSAGAQFGCSVTLLTRSPVWRRRAGHWGRFPRPDPPARLFWPAPPDPDL